MFYVVVTILEDLSVDALMGPFDTAKEAMDWADLDACNKIKDNPEFTRESTDEMMILSDLSEEGVEEPAGFVYQVVQSTPIIMAQSEIER